MVLVLLAGVASPAAATADVLFTAQEESLPVQIKADTFRYDRRTRVLTATGNVILTVEDVRILADALVANLETGEVSAEGNVRLETRGQSVAGDLLTYNLSTRVGTLLRARTDVTGPLVLGRIHLRAERLEGIPNEFVTIKGGFLTTCDEEDPVIFLTADELTVYVNDRIVGRRVSVWLGGRRLFTLPSFVLHLRERRQSRFLPVVGYGATEGYYVRSTYNYVLSPDHDGVLLADYFERLGVGVGIEHTYRVGGGTGTALLYRLANRQIDGTEWRALLTHRQQLGPAFTAQVYADYFRRTSTVQPEISAGFAALDLSHTTATSSTFLFTTLSGDSSGSSTLGGQLAHRQVLTTELTGQAFLDFSRHHGALGTDDEVMPRVALQYAGPSLYASLVADLRWDVDGSRYLLDDQYTLERLPELTVSLPAFRLGDSPLIAQVDAGLGRFREAPGPGAAIVDTVRTDATVTVGGPWSFAGGVIGTRVFARGSWYGSAQGRLFYGGRAEYVRGLGPSLETRLGYTGQSVAGSSPFLFDQISSVLSLADVQLFYRGAPGLFAEVTGSYDLLARRYGAVTAQALALPRPGWAMALAASYDPNLGALDRVETHLDLQISPSWHVQYLGGYDGITRRVVHDRLAITRIFCECLAVSLSYLGARSEVWLETWLTAIPWSRGRIGIGGQGTLLFDHPFPFPGPYPPR